ncbi:MAG: hypothetical protein AAF916_07000 [Planctomycetota bacterium]
MPTNTETRSSFRAFDDAVWAAMKDDPKLSRNDAISKVRVDQPQLYAAMMEEANPGADLNHLSTKPAANDRPAVRRFNGHVSAALAMNPRMTRADAVKHVIKTKPDLHAAALAEAQA